MIANGGNYVRPTLIKEVKDINGNKISDEEIDNYVNELLGINTEYNPEVQVSEQTLNTIKSGMRLVTSSGGTAYSVFKDFDYSVAGKTGSAQARADPVFYCNGTEKSVLFPGGRGEQHQHREQLQAACQHIEAEHQLGKHRKAGEVLRGANRSKAGTDVAERGGGRREGGHKILAVKGEQQQRQRKQGKQTSEIHKDGAHRFRLDLLLANGHLFDALGVDGVADLARETLEQNENARDLYTAAGAAGAGANEIKQDQDGDRNRRPKIEIDRCKARGGELRL